MKRFAFLVAVVSLLAPGEARAKGGDVHAIRVCGPARCVTLTDETQIQIVLSIGAYGKGRAPAEPAPFYAISTVPPGDRDPLYRYVPTASVAREAAADGGAWLAVPGFVSDLLYWQATRGLRPYSAPERGSDVPVTALVVAGAAVVVIMSAALAVRRHRTGRVVSRVQRDA